MSRDARRLAWLVLAAILALTLLLRAAVTGLSPLLPRVAADVPLTPIEAGLLGAMPPACFAAAALLGPVLLRRFAAEHLVLASLALGAAGQLVRPFVDGPAAFMAMSAVALLGAGTGNVVLPVLAKAWFPNRIPSVTAVYVTGLTLGTAVPSLVAVPLADAVRSSFGDPALGWQVSLGWWGGLCLLVALAWLVPAARPRAVPTPDDGPAPPRGLWRSRTAVGVLCIFASNALVSYACFAWLPTRLTDAGTSETSAGAVLALFAAMGIPAALLVPQLAARVHPRWITVQFAVFFSAGMLGFLLSPTVGTPVWAVVAGWGTGGFPLALTLVGLRTRTPAAAGALSGFVQGGGYVVAGVGPIAVGALHEVTGGWTAPMLLLAAGSGIMVVGGLLAGRGTVEADLERRSPQAVAARPVRQTVPDTLER